MIEIIVLVVAVALLAMFGWAISAPATPEEKQKVEDAARAAWDTARRLEKSKPMLSADEMQDAFLAILRASFDGHKHATIDAQGKQLMVVIHKGI